MGSMPANNDRGLLFDDGTLPPLAVIGMSFRFPQDATDASLFWNMLLEKRCASTEVPPDRFDVNSHYHPDKDQLESTSVRNGHFITGDLGAWDAPFFNITASEAEAMDPSQRLTLEAAFRALENAGLPLDKVAGSKTSVYSATFMRDYDYLQNHDPDIQAKYRGIGAAPNMLSNRVSWFFDMQGPSGSVDTACSSSLLALDLVCQSIWSGDADMGLACGNNIMLTPYTTISLDNLGLLGKDGRCYSFDHRANGYARGEGVGVVVVKPLSAAIRDGDTVRAVVRSSCSNQDGRTPTISQPSREAQEKLIRDAHAKAGLDLGVTRYFEAHGTGTPVGDPIETSSIGSAYRRYRSAEDPLYVGSVKSNIGHLEGAAGVAGVIKAILALEAGVIPPQANFEKLNSAIDTEFLNIKIPSEATPWPTTGLRRASIQSFGIGGSNSHVILDDAHNFLKQRGLIGNHNTVPEPPLTPSRLREVLPEGTSKSQKLQESEQLLVWSAADSAGIKRIAPMWKDYLAKLQISQQQRPELMVNLAHTLAARRTHFTHRAYAVSDPSEELGGLMEHISPSVRAAAAPKLAFIFSGQGSQWFAMGRELFDRYPLYRNSLVEASLYLEGLGCSWNAVGELMRTKTDSNVDDAEFSQPLCTIVQVALVDLLDSFGLRPVKVAGHSSGEIAAAYCARALTKHAAWKIAYLRGLLASQLTLSTSSLQSKIQGGMMAVGLSADEAEPYLQQVTSELGCKRLVVACVNSPANVTISGEASHLDHLQSILSAVPEKNIFARKLRVKLAYHSFQMQEVAEEYLARLGALSPPPVPSSARHGSVPVMASSVTGTWIRRDELSKAEYWVQNLVSPVLFSDALATVCASEDAVGTWRGTVSKLDGSHARALPVSEIVEIGPHSAMQGPVREILRGIGKEGSVRYAPALVRNRSAITTILELAGRLHCLGHKVHLDVANSSSDGQNLSTTKSSLSHPKVLSTLPEYPFNHAKSYWAESRLSKAFRFRKFNRHDLLGAQSFDWNPLEARWRHFIRTSDLPWVKHHKISGSILYPAAGMLVMAVEAARQLADTSLDLEGFTFRDVSFHSALIVPEGSQGVEVNLHMRPRKDAGEKDSGWYDFRLYRHDSANPGTWDENCNGSIQLNYAAGTEDNHGSEDMGKAKESQAWVQQRLSRVGEAKIACQQVADSQALYEQLAASGYGYGPTFQGIKHMQYDGTDTSVSTVQTYKWSRHFEGQDPGANHIIHPTTLDTILHTMLGIYTQGGTQKIATTIPTFVERIWITAKGGLDSTTAEDVTVVTGGKRSGLRESRSALLVTDPNCQSVLIDVDNFQTTAVASGSENEAEDMQSNTKPAYTLDWKPDPTLWTDTQLQTFLDQSVSNVALKSSDQDESIDQLIVSVMRRTLEVLKDAPSVSGRHGKYMDWMQRQVSSLSSLDTKVFIDDDEIERSIAKLEGYEAESKLFASIARHHFSLLNQADATNDLPSLDGIIEQYLEYITNEAQSPPVAGLCALVDCMAHKTPDLRVLEISDGSLAITDRLVQTLTTREGRKEASPTPRFSKYDYTTTDVNCLDMAKEKYAGLEDRVKCVPLDVAKGIEGQEDDRNGYDVAVISNLHQDLPDLGKILEIARRSLKAGGKLVVTHHAESRNPLRTNFVCGMKQEWWTGENTTGAISGQTVDDGWDNLFHKAGLSNSQALIGRQHDASQGGDISVAITSPSLDSLSAPSSSDRNVVFVHLDNNTEQQHMAQKLRSTLQSSTTPQYANVNIASVTEAVNMLPISDTTMLVFLLEMTAPVLYDVEPTLFDRLQKLLTSNMAAKMLWVGREMPRLANDDDVATPPQPSYRLIDGLARVLNSETDSETLSFLTLQNQESNINDIPIEEIDDMLAVVKKIDQAAEGYPDTEWIQKNGWLCVPRMIQSASLNQEISSRVTPRQEVYRSWKDDTAHDGQGVPLKLALGTPGLLNTLHFVEDADVHQEPLLPHQVEVKVEAVGLNYRDVLIALGRLQNAHVGCECAGVVTRVGADVQDTRVGDRVAALAPFGCYRTFLRVDGRFTARIPDEMPFSIAAAMVVNHLTAWSTLSELGRLQPGETVLVHSAAGGTGQAAVQVAHHLGANVLATAGTPDKKSHLTAQYGLDEDHIFSSRDAKAFSRGVQRTTDGRGVDMVLNALSGEGLLASWECLAPFGRFMEIGKRDIHARKSLPMARFDDGLSFQAFDVGVLCTSRPGAIRPTLERLFALHEEGVLAPASPLQVHGVSELEKIFRTMQRGQTMGKIVIEMRPEEKVKAVLDPKPTTRLPPNASYLIAGGLGGLGRSMAGWLVDRGARNLILLARSGVRTQEARDFVDDMTRRGVRVATPPCDVADAKALESVLEQCRRDGMPRVRGAIQATMVLRDAVFLGMTHDTWQSATAPKVQGSWNMHALLPSDMDFFIGLSSVAGVAGGRGQANYAAGNTFIDALMEYRVSRGQSGVTLDLGAFLDIGFVTQSAGLKARWEARRAMAVTEDELFALLDCYCTQQGQAQQRPPAQAIFGISGYVGDKSTGHYFRKPMLRTLALEDEDSSQAGTGQQGNQSSNQIHFETVFAASKSLAAAGEAVNKALLEKLASSLALSREELDADTPLHAYGVDSLVAVELRNWFAKEVHAELAIFDVLGGATARTASMLAAAKTRFEKRGWEEGKE